MTSAIEVGVGIIPACAGSSSARLWGGDVEGDHPRACGEQSTSNSATSSAPGSSPRMRGAVLAKPLVRRLRGIIPAHAGSRLILRRGRQLLGIIPACAGSSTATPARSTRSRDHPRVCGEQKLTTPRRARLSGSSPRGRGAGVLEGEHRLRRGIIPAHAGSSSRKSASSSTTRDHPRACREQEWHHTLPFGTQGSSPRMQGAAYRKPYRVPNEGIIPARAGNRLKRRRTLP